MIRKKKLHLNLSLWVVSLGVFFILVVILLSIPTISGKAAKKHKQESPVIEVKSAGMDSITIGWKKVAGSKGYQIMRAGKKDGPYKTIKEIKSTEYKDNNLSKSQTYYYKVRAVFSESGENTYSAYSNQVRKVKVLGNYKQGSVYGPALSSTQLEAVGDRVAEFVNVLIKPGMTDVEKVAMAHDYLVNFCDYAEDWSKNKANTAWGALVYGEAQCSGYARAFKALCDGMGIGCYFVHADKKSVNPSHQWNIVCIDDKWYHIDVQANDSSMDYVIYLIRDKEVKNLGLSWDTKEYPKCSSNYY